MGKTVGSTRGKSSGASGTGEAYEGLTAKETAAASAFEQKILDKKVERMAFIDSNGNTILEKEGTERAVRFEVNEIFNERFNGSIGIHNHPSNTNNSFSMADISLALRQGQKETRVITKDLDGNTVLYRMQFAEEMDLGATRDAFFATGSMNFKVKRGLQVPGNDLIEHADLHEFFVTGFKKYDERVRRDFTYSIEFKGMRPEVAESTHWHEVWTRYAKEVKGIKYSRTVLK